MEINEKFYKLSKEKQMLIINAGLECFGKYGYQKANTEMIALKAGISKALLFHYFKNKKIFYLYLCEFCIEVSKKSIDLNEVEKITDFFELIEYSLLAKWKIISEYPYMSNFALNAYYSKNEDITKDVNENIEKELVKSFDIYFKNIDLTKFKDEIDPKYIYHMLVLLSEGYLIEKQRSNISMDFESAIVELRRWQDILRNSSYKEEYR